LFNLVAPARAPCGFQITLRPYFYFFLSMFWFRLFNFPFFFLFWVSKKWIKFASQPN
jgi:hypothetical protein